MRIAEVVGRVTLSRCHPSLTGAIWKIVVPLSREGIEGDVSGRGEPLIAYDEIGTGTKSLVALSESAEAAAPFRPELKPVDAYCAALLDAVTLAPPTKSK